MRSQFRISLLVVAAATLVIMVLMSSSTRWEEKASAAASPKLKISQFRENGPANTGIGGSQDEFIEIYNNTDVNFTVGTTDPSNQGGIGVFASAGNGVTDNVVTIVCLIPNGTVIPARGHVLCVNVNGYSLSSLGSTNSTTGGGSNPGPTFITGGGTASVGNFPIINGTPTQAGAFTCQQVGCTPTGNGAANGVGTSVDIPNDAGLVLINVGDNTVTASSNVIDNGSFGFGATGVSPADIIVYDRVGFAPYGSGAPLQKCQLANTASCGAAGNARPSLADQYCEGAPSGCLRPVGDASTENHGSVVFYGDSGQYALIRRETAISSTGTNPLDTENNVNDFLMVAPDPGINIALNITGFPTGVTNGLVSVLGSAGPLNIQGGIDFPETVLASRFFDTGRTGAQLPNAERRYVIDNQATTVNAGNMATTQQYNNPIGSLILRFGFRSTATTGTAIDKFRVRVDELAVPCGAGTPATASATPGNAEARNLHQTAPNCQQGTVRTAVLKVLNMPSELVARETNNADNPATGTVRGSVIEDAAGSNQTAYFGGGINNSVVRTGTAQGNLTGEYTTSIPNSVGSAETNNFYMAFRFGVVKGGSFRFVLQPEGTKGSTAAPTVTPVPAP